MSLKYLQVSGFDLMLIFFTYSCQMYVYDFLPRFQTSNTEKRVLEPWQLRCEITQNAVILVNCSLGHLYFPEKLYCYQSLWCYPAATEEWWHRQKAMKSLLFSCIYSVISKIIPRAPTKSYMPLHIDGQQKSLTVNTSQ